MRKKRKTDEKEISGRIITIIFVALLIGGAYFLFTLFRPLEINSHNIVGTWKLKGKPNTYYTFALDQEDPEDLMKGTASSYTQFDNSTEISDKTKYTYTISINKNGVYELYLQPLNERGRSEGDPYLMKVTGVSKAQMYITIDRKEMTAMTNVNLF